MATTPTDLVFIYTNHRGETAERRVVPETIRFASTRWHREPQWLLGAYDLDRGERRDFAWKDIRFGDAAAGKGITHDQPQTAPDLRLWWFLHTLDACGKRGAEANDEPGEWVAAFCGDAEPKDTFNRACDLKLAGWSHNTMDETSRVWITDAGKAWLAARPVLPVETPSERLREALTEALVVMRLATGFPAVENEIDLWPAIKSATAALASTGPATVPSRDGNAT